MDAYSQRVEAIKIVKQMQPAEINHVPDQWKRLELTNLDGLLMVVGATDTGKTTFVKYLLNQLNQKYPVIACIDGDPGQSRLGPPATMSLMMQSLKNSNENAPRSWRKFIGSVSPPGHMLQVLMGSFRLLEKARELGAGVIIFDTSGWVDIKTGGANLKLSKIDLIRPQTLFVLQRNRELESWLLPLRKSSRINIVDIVCVSEDFRRNFNVRRSYRIDRFRQYFALADIVEVNCSSVAVFPSSIFKRHQLVSFEDKEGFTLSLGIVLAADTKSPKVNFYSPITQIELSVVCSITIGDLVIDPKTFNHGIIEDRSAQTILKLIRKLWNYFPL